MLQAMARDNGPINHLGYAFYGFIRRYGIEFKYDVDAVAVGRGGIVRKDELGPEFNRYNMLSLEDPLTGAGGSRL
jgi:DNA polymerase sigma